MSSDARLILKRAATADRWEHRRRGDYNLDRFDGNSKNDSTLKRAARFCARASRNRWKMAASRIADSGSTPGHQGIRLTDLVLH